MPLTEQEMQSILEHMNQDHLDALRLYVSYFGGIHGVRHVEMREITRHEMRLHVEAETVECMMALPLTRPIESATDARMVLVEMARAARQGLATEDEAREV